MKIDWENVTNYLENVGSVDKVFSFPKAQSAVQITNRGSANLIYTIGSQSGTLTPTQSVKVTETISSFTLRSSSGSQLFECWGVEAGTEQDEEEPDLASLASSLADIATVNNHSITYGYDANGNVQTVTEKDSTNNVIKTVTYTYDSTTGNVSQSVTVMNGKTVTTTYTYDPTTGNITSTSNVIS